MPHIMKENFETSLAGKPQKEKSVARSLAEKALRRAVLTAAAVVGLSFHTADNKLPFKFEPQPEGQVTPPPPPDGKDTGSGKSGGGNTFVYKGQLYPDVSTLPPEDTLEIPNIDEEIHPDTTGIFAEDPAPSKPSRDSHGTPFNIFIDPLIVAMKNKHDIRKSDRLFKEATAGIDRHSSEGYFIQSFSAKEFLDMEKENVPALYPKYPNLPRIHQIMKELEEIDRNGGPGTMTIDQYLRRLEAENAMRLNLHKQIIIEKDR